MKKRSFSLLEILIALSLAAILFAVLFSKIREHISLRLKLKSAQQECLERQSFHIRLTEVLDKLAPSTKNGKIKAPLSSSDRQIHFHIDVPLDVSPSRLGDQDCTLWLDIQEELVYLSTTDASGKKKDEVLSRKVKGWSYRFFSAKNKAWSKEWPEDSLEAPTFVSIQCKKDSGDIEFLFPLHSPMKIYQ